MSRRRDECIRFSHEIFRACDILLRSKNPTPQQFAKIGLGALYEKAGPVDDIKRAQHDMLTYIKDVANGRELRRASTYLEKAVRQSGASHMTLAHGHRALAIAQLQLQNNPSSSYVSMSTALQESAKASGETFMETFCIHWNLFDYCKAVERPSDPWVPTQVAAVVLLLGEIAGKPRDYVSDAAGNAQALFVPALRVLRKGASIYSAAKRGNLSELQFEMDGEELLDAQRCANLVDSQTAGAWALATWLQNQAISAIDMLHGQGLLD